MKHRSFDNYVKEQLSGAKPGVPPHIWENIVAEQGKKKPFAFGWFTGLNLVAALLIISAVSGTIYLVSNHNTAKENPGSSVVKTNPQPGNDQTNNNNNSTPNNNTISVQPDAANFSSAPHVNGSTKNIFPSIADASASVLNSKQTNNLYFPSRLNINTTNSIAEQNAGKNVNDNNEQGNEEYNHNFVLADNRSGIDLMLQGSASDPRLKVPFMLHGLYIPCPEAEKNAAGNKKYIEIYAGPDYAFNSVNDYSDANYTQQRKNSTSPMMSYSAGIRYTKVWGSGVSIRTGINYSRINESFKQEKGHVTQNVYITNERGDTIGTSTVTGTQYKQNTNKITTIDIPIMGGYEIGNGRLHTNINAGVMMNLISRQKGLVLDKSGNAVDVSSGAPSTVYQYKNNTGVSLAGAVSVYYKLNDRMHLLAEPYFRYGISPVTKNELSLKQKYHTAGLRLGIRMDL